MNIDYRLLTKQLYLSWPSVSLIDLHISDSTLTWYQIDYPSASSFWRKIFSISVSAQSWIDVNINSPKNSMKIFPIVFIYSYCFCAVQLLPLKRLVSWNKLLSIALYFLTKNLNCVFNNKWQLARMTREILQYCIFCSNDPTISGFGYCLRINRKEPI